MNIEIGVKQLYGDVRLSKVYDCKDGRKRIDVISENYRKTFQLAKIILEVKLGRVLIGTETVDHIDGDKSNDHPDNLRVLSLSNNAADSAIRLKTSKFICPQCNSNFELTGRKLKDAVNNRTKGKAGPFCGRSCAGKYGTSIQYHGTIPLDIPTIERHYYSNKNGSVSELVYELVLEANALVD
jgi:hypothetical protein